MVTLTQIKLYNNSLLPNDISGGYLECDTNTVVPLNFAIADIRDISTKKGVFSKSITLPGTKNNHKILNNYFDVNIVSGTFDVNKLQWCSIIQDGVVILDNAILQLVSVNKTQNNSTYEENVTYTVLVKDATSDFFTNINNKELTNLDLSDMDHVYTDVAVVNSFSNTVEQGYKYVMPYNSANLDSEGSDSTFDLVEFTPSIYAKKYWDKIFSGAGYSYNWVGMTASDIRFDKLVIPYNGDVVRADKEESAIYTATAERTGTSSLYYQTKIWTTRAGNKLSVSSSQAFKIDVPTEINDPLNNYSPTQSIYTTPNIPSVYNNVKYNVTADWELVVDNPYVTNVYFVGLYVNPFNQDQFRYSTNAATLSPSILLMKNDEIIYTNSLYTKIYNSSTFAGRNQPFAPSSTTVVATGSTTFTNVVEGLTPDILMSLKAQLLIEYQSRGVSTSFDFYDTPSPLSGVSPVAWYPITLGSGKPNAKWRMVLKNVYVNIVCELDGDVSYNVPLKMNKFIPKKIKQSDFIKGILTMFNLYVEVDKYIPNRLNIISRDEYYDSGKIEDWTKKLVKEQPQEMKFIPEITKKKMILTYKYDDKDWASKRYKEATNEIYGQAEYIFDNEYVKDINTTELLFSPTPVANTPFGAICPIINGQAPDSNIRILYDGGTMSVGQYTIVKWPQSSQTDTTPLAIYNVAPLITHWDRATNPTYDLNFLPCDFYYRSDDYGSNTNNNLFNLHWRRTMNQINQGKIMTAFFNLNSYDIQKMRLNDKIRIDNSWWNINSIKDYNANSQKSTKVELISMDDSAKISFKERTTYRIDRGNPIMGVLNQLALSKQGNINKILSDNIVTVTGRYNYIGPDFRNGVVYGDYNSVTEGAVVYGDSNIVESKSFVIGSNNTISNEVVNSFIVGDGITATESNTLYTNNIIMASGSTINGTPVVNITTLFEKGTGEASIEQIVAEGSTPNDAQGDNSISVGVENISSGIAAFSSGYTNESSGNYSATLNYNNRASGQSSIATGESGASVGNQSLTSGLNNTANSLGETVIGHYSESVSGSPTTIVGGDTIFRVGIGTSTAARKDGFRVYKNSAIKLNPVTSASITTPTLGMIIFDSVTNDIKIYNGTGWVTVGSTNMEKQLIIRFTGTTTRDVIKDDLGINSSLTINTTDVAAGTINGVQYYRTITEIVFPSGYNTGKVVVQFENSDNFIAPSTGAITTTATGVSFGYGYIERPNTTTLQLFSGRETTNSGQRIIGNILILTFYP